MAELSRSSVPGFSIDEEFQNLCPHLGAEERRLLEESIAAEGVRDRLVVWQEEKVLLDGHTRFAICSARGLPFEVIELSFPDRDAARNWIIDTALGRRNLSDDQRQYLRGRRLLAERKDPVVTLRKGADAPLPQCEGAGETAERIARATGVSRATIERDARYAADVDRISATAGPEAKQAILSGDIKLTRGDARRIAAAAPKSLDEVRAAATPKRFDLASLNRLARSSAKTDDRDHLKIVTTLASRTAAALRAYAKAGARPEHHERLAEVWDLRSDIERLATYLEGGKGCS